jgi:hypothetical protein
MSDIHGKPGRVPRRSIVISDKLWGCVQEAAASLGIARAEYVRIALLERLEHDQKAKAGAAPPAPAYRADATAAQEEGGGSIE